MSNLPNDLATWLRAAGLEVIETSGWTRRGRPGSFRPVGVLNHHTGASAKGWTRAKRLAYAMWMFVTGRSDLPAPLCQIALGPDGEVYLGAVGRANHAGTARSSGSVSAGDGNTLYVGIEWMLSGTEFIPAKMLAAGITLNAVLTERFTKTSVQTISCHWNTSITGKWDIGDPNGVAYKGHKVLDTLKFRKAVDARRDALYRKESPVAGRPNPAPEPGKSTLLKVAHMSGQFSDSTSNWLHDGDVVFDRGYDLISFTEVSNAAQWGALKKMAAKHGYYVRRYKTNAVAAKMSIVKPGTLTTKNYTVVAKEKVAGKGADTSIATLTFVSSMPGLGKVSMVGSHYPLLAKQKGTARQKINLRWARLTAQKVGSVMEALGKGTAIAFYAGDQNDYDKRVDTFFGEPVTSCWDEIEHWPNTGHGNIDVIASYDRDARVTCENARAFTDGQVFLYTDHFLIEATYRVGLLKH